MGKRGSSSASSKVGITAPRVERKIIEKNRRLRMKSLYLDLISLIPDHRSKMEGLPLPDQIDEAVEYINILKKKLEKLRQKKESLILPRKTKSLMLRSPLVEIHEMGPKFDIILANGLQDYSKFLDIIRLLHQHGVEIASASFSGDGISTIHVLRDKVEKSKVELGGATTSRKLKELVCGTSSNEVKESLLPKNVMESQLDLWDYEIESDIWGFDIPAGIQCHYEELYT